MARLQHCRHQAARKKLAVRTAKAQQKQLAGGVVSCAQVLSVDIARQQSAQQQPPSLLGAVPQVARCADAAELAPACVAGHLQWQSVPATGAGGLPSRG